MIALDALKAQHSEAMSYCSNFHTKDKAEIIEDHNKLVVIRNGLLQIFKEKDIHISESDVFEAAQRWEEFEKAKRIREFWNEVDPAGLRKLPQPPQPRNQ